MTHVFARLGRVVTGHPRTVGAGLLAALVYAVLPGTLLPGTLLPTALLPSTRGVIAWDIGSIGLLVTAVLMFARCQGDAAMANNAERQDAGEWTIFAITLAATTASFVAVTVVLHAVKDMEPLPRQLHVGLVAVTLLLSWLMSHIVFAIRYAHEYYSRTPGADKVDGGLEFPGDGSPDYWDFVYFAIVIGMTFQVSDVQITSRKLRRLATVHGLLAFLFNTVIVALTVNIAAGLL